ncbi:MarR family winged helix-turn-helix transcriptional regulator [Paraburkholderia xenovorans]
MRDEVIGSARDAARSINCEDSMFDQFLTFKLDLIKSEMINQANVAYRSAYDLDVRMLRVLRLICDEPGITATSVSGQTLIEKTLLSKLLAALIERKLIRRTIHPEDARHFELWPTAAGTRVRKDSNELGMKLEQDMLSALSSLEREQLDRITDKLVEAFRRSATI